MKTLIKLFSIIILYSFAGGCSDNPSDTSFENDPNDELGIGDSKFEVSGEVEGKMTGNAEIIILVEESPLSEEIFYILYLTIIDDNRVGNRVFRIDIAVELQNEAIPLSVFDLGVWHEIGGYADYTHINADLIGTDYRTIEGYSGKLEITELDGDTATGSFEFTAATFQEGTAFGEITVKEGEFIAPVVVVYD